MMRAIWIVVFLQLGLAFVLTGQNINVTVANLEQDVRALQRDVGRLRIETEALVRENAELRKAVSSQLESNRSQLVTIGQLNQAIAALQTQVNAASDRQKREIIAEVSKQIEALATQTQRAINALARSIESRPQVDQVVTFSDNYPTKGVQYVIQPGDTLGSIARRHNSRVEWIRNANRMPNDTIFPGREIFIPQE
jgi:LysM repeat protein